MLASEGAWLREESVNGESTEGEAFERSGGVSRLFHHRRRSIDSQKTPTVSGPFLTVVAKGLRQKWRTGHAGDGR